MNFLEKLDYMMAKRNLNKRSLAMLSDVPYTTIVTFYKNGYENTKLTTIRKLAEALDVSLDYLLVDSITDEDYGKTAGFTLNHNEMLLVRKFRALDEYGAKAVKMMLNCEYERCTAWALQADNILPLLLSEQRASAGTGLYLGPETFSTIHVVENSLTRKATFSVPVYGDSMEPAYHDGDLLLVEGTTSVKVGEVGLFTLDGEGYVKERGENTLISLNPAYEPIKMNESIRCFGRVIGVLDPAWIRTN